MNMILLTQLLTPFNPLRIISTIDAEVVTWYSQTRLSKAGRVSNFISVLQRLQGELLGENHVRR